MTFLQPALLWTLPLAALPILIHLIHLYRRRQVKWAAMLFLRAAQRMNKGLSRLRQVLILALRVLAVAALLFVLTRPLAGGWLGLTGGAPDTVLILLDRSASMEQRNVATGISKHTAGLRNLAKAIDDAVGSRSRLVLIDSAWGKAESIENTRALLDHPATTATDTAADIPALLQGALDYITTNQTGRTDVWLLSDLQRSDWDATSGRWATLRSAFATLPGVRFHLLCYPEAAPDDLGVTVERVLRRETSDKAELLLDLRITSRAAQAERTEVPLRVVINGVTTTLNVALIDRQLVLQAHAIPIDRTVKRGWGRIELPSDSNPANDVFHFVFDEPAPMQSIIVSDDQATIGPLEAALSAPSDPARRYHATVLGTARTAEIPWEETALVVWHAPIPKAGEMIARQLENHVAAGRTVIFLPPESPGDASLFGLRWERWGRVETDTPQTVEWWRNDADLLANARDGSALPVGTLEISRRCGIGGEGVPLARIGENAALLVRAALASGGGAYFLGTLPADSSLARDGLVLFALLHRALAEGARTLGHARQLSASASALGSEPAHWRPAEPQPDTVLAAMQPLRACVFSAGDRLAALNRPPGEDQPQVLASEALADLFAGLDFRVLTDSLARDRSLTNEIWRTFLVAMALALVGEALLCMPPRREAKSATAV